MVSLGVSEKELACPQLKVGILFCGRQAPGGHNVISGLYDFLKASNPKSELYGFIGGTAGLFQSSYVKITDEMLSTYRNQGGFDLIGRAADKIRDGEEQELAGKTCEQLGLDGLVLIGGCYTNTDAGHLAEYFVATGIKTRVIGVPVTITRDMKSKLVETTVGFDTACRVYSELIGNLCTDGNSAKKYYYFIRLMGRKSGHIPLECALETHPNMLLLGEEANRNHESLGGVISKISDLVVRRHEECKRDFGVVLIPEGYIENIHELKTLIDELNELLNHGKKENEINENLTPWSRALYESLPTIIQSQLLKERESRGNIQLSQISSEKLFAELVKRELNHRKKLGKYNGTFSPVTNYLGYKERSSLPSNFDCDLGYSCGYGAGSLIMSGITGCLVSIYNLNEEVCKWKVVGIPLNMLMNDWEVDASGRCFITPSKITLHGDSYRAYKQNEKIWAVNDDYENPGPLQFIGNGSKNNNKCLLMDEKNHLDRVNRLRGEIENLLEICKVGVSQNTLLVIENNIESLNKIIPLLRGGRGCHKGGAGVCSGPCCGENKRCISSCNCKECGCNGICKCKDGKCADNCKCKDCSCCIDKC